MKKKHKFISIFPEKFFFLKFHSFRRSHKGSKSAHFGGATNFVFFLIFILSFGTFLQKQYCSLLPDLTTNSQFCEFWYFSENSISDFEGF